MHQSLCSTSYKSFLPVLRCLQGASSPDPTTVYCDLRALRNDRVTLTERGAPHSLALMESGKLLPGVNVIIANPGSREKDIRVFSDYFCIICSLNVIRSHVNYLTKCSQENE